MIHVFVLTITSGLPSLPILLDFNEILSRMNDFAELVCLLNKVIDSGTFLSDFNVPVERIALLNILIRSIFNLIRPVH